MPGCPRGVVVGEMMRDPVTGIVGRVDVAPGATRVLGGGALG